MSAGYLPPGSLAFLLAVQAVVRRMDARALAKHLEANQAALFSRAARELAPERDALIVALGLPAETEWPKERALKRFVEPIDLSGGAELDDTPPALLEGRGANRGRVVFRVPRSNFLGWAFGGLWLAVLIGAVTQNLPAFLLALPFTVACGVLIGKGRGWYECSDPQCKATLTIDHDRCPRCNGRVEGSIARASDRLAALETWKEGRAVMREVERSPRRRKKRRP
jgi:hypothetical protein